jgi:hypothetical protein
VLIFRKLLTIFLCGSLIAASGGPLAAAPFALEPAKSAFDIPSHLGFITETYQGAVPGHVVLIQDLHINWDAQTHIAGILEHYAKGGILPERVGVEGAEGPVSAAILAAYPDPEIRKQVADYFVRQGELTGAGAYAVISGRSDLLHGIENIHYYELNKRLFQQSYPARQDLHQELQWLKTTLNQLLRKHTRRPVHQIQRLAKNYADGELSPAEYATALWRHAQAAKVPLPSQRYLLLPMIARSGFPQSPNPSFLHHLDRELNQLSFDLTNHLATSDLERNLWRVKNNIRLGQRLMNQQLTEMELGRFVADLPRFLKDLQTLLDVPDTARMKEIFQNAVDYYALAMTREQPMLEHTLQLLQRSPRRQAIVIAGGFHSSGLLAQLKTRRLSYAVITPRIDSLPATDHALYTERLLDRHLSDPATQTLATGDWILSNNPLARRIALGRLAQAVYARIRADHPAWTPAQIAAELQQRLATHPAVDMTPRQLADYAHSIAIAPVSEQPIFEEEGPWQFLLRHTNRTVWEWILRTLGAFWMWTAIDPIAAHRRFNSFSPIRLAFDPHKVFSLNTLLIDYVRIPTAVKVQEFLKLEEMPGKVINGSLDLTPTLRIRVPSTNDADVMLKFIEDPDDPQRLLLRIRDHHNFHTFTVEIVNLPVIQAYPNLAYLKGITAEQKLTDQLGAFYRDWRGIGALSQKALFDSDKRSLRLIHMMQAMQQVPHTVSNLKEIVIGAHFSKQPKLEVPDLSPGSKVQISVQAIYRPDGSMSIYLKLTDDQGRVSFFLPDEDRKLQFVRFSTLPELFQHLHLDSANRSFVDAFNRYAFAQEYEQDLSGPAADVLNAGPQAVVVKNGYASLKDDPEGIGSFQLHGFEDGIYTLIPFFNGTDPSDTWLYFRVNNKELVINLGRLYARDIDRVQPLKRQKKQEWMTRRLKVYRDLWKEGNDVSEAARILVDIPPIQQPRLAQGVLMEMMDRGEILRIRVPFPLGPITVSAHYWDDDDRAQGVYLKLVDPAGAVVYADPIRTRADSFASLDELRKNLPERPTPAETPSPKVAPAISNEDADHVAYAGLINDLYEASESIRLHKDLHKEVPGDDNEQRREVHKKLVDWGPIQWITLNGLIKFPTGRRLVDRSFRLVGVKTGTQVTITARYWNEKRPEEGIYFEIEGPGFKSFVQEKHSKRYSMADRNVFRSYSTFEKMKAEHEGDFPGVKPKRNKDFEAAVALFARYRLLDLATALSNNPEELHKAITVALANQPDVTDPPLRKLTMAYALHLQEGNAPPAGVRAKPGDSASVAAALMALHEEIERMETHEQNLFVESFLRISFLRIANDPEGALKEIESELGAYPETKLRKRLLDAVTALVKEALTYQPAHIATPMKPHQRVGAWKLRQSDSLREQGIYGFLLEDDTRLGKTIQFLAAFDPSWKGLVTMPAGVLEIWRKQASLHATPGSFRVVAVTGTPEEKRQIIEKEKNQKGVLLLISEESLRNLDGSDMVSLNHGLDVVGVDEAQTIENFHGENDRANSDQAEAVHALRPQRFWFMSATPYTSRPDQLYSILRLLHRDPTGKITNSLFATREAFRAWVNRGKNGLAALYVLKSMLSIRRTKEEVGQYTSKNDIDPANEGIYSMPKEQSRLVLRIIRNLGQYLVRYNLNKKGFYDASSVGRFLKLHLLGLAQVDPAFLGEAGATNFWDTLDAIVDKRVVRGQKGILVAQSKEVVDAVISHFQNREKNPLRVARLDGAVDGDARDLQGNRVHASYVKGRTVLGEEGDVLSAKGYQQYLFNEVDDVPLIVINANAAQGIDLSRGDFEVFLQPTKHYVQYHQARDRPIGLEVDPTNPKTVEILHMVPQMDPEVVQEAVAAGDERFVEHGSPVEVIRSVIFGEQQQEFDQVVRGISTSSPLPAPAAGLIKSLFVDSDPSMKKKKAVVREFPTESVFYPVWHQLKQRADVQQEDLQELAELVAQVKERDLDAAPLAAALVAHPNLNVRDLRYITALLSMGNKYYRDRLLRMLPNFYRHLQASRQSIATLAETGPPGLRILASEHPALVIPFLAATHAWEGTPPGWHVFNDVLDKILTNGFSDHEAQLAARRYIHSLIPLIDLDTPSLLFMVDRYHAGILGDGMALEDQLTFFEELGVLKSTDPEDAAQLLVSRSDFPEFRQDLNQGLFRSTLAAFELNDTPEVRGQLMALFERWGSLQAPLRLLAKLRSGDPARYGEHIRKFKTAIRHIIAGTHDAWRNQQSIDRDGSEIEYKKDDPAFWEAFTLPELVSLGDVTVLEKDRRAALERHVAVVQDQLENEEFLKAALGPLTDDVVIDLQDPEEALSTISAQLREKGQERGRAEGKARAALDAQLSDLALRLKIAQLAEALLEGANTPEELRNLRDRANAVGQGLANRLGHEASAGSVLVQSLRALSGALAESPEERRWKDVTVEFTSDPDWMMRRGMLEEDLIDCFNLEGNVAQVATLIDDLSSRNKILAIVRVEGRIVSRSIVKVNTTEDRNPVLHIERPLYRGGYAFENEIGRALAQTKAPAMHVSTITRYLSSSESPKDTMRVYSTGTRAPTEYHESLFSWRLRGQTVYYQAKRLAVPVVASSSEIRPPLMTPGLRRLLQRGGAAMPSLWKQSWIAGDGEYKLTWNRNLFVRRHRPQTLLQRLGYNLGWGAIWAGTWIVPAAAASVAVFAAGVMLPVALGLAAGAWWATQRVMNITTHALIDFTVGNLKKLYKPIQKKLETGRERRRMKISLSAPAPHAPEVPALSTPSLTIRRLLSETPDAPSRTALRTAYERIRAAA